MDKDIVFLSDQWANKYPLRAFLATIAFSIAVGLVFCFLLKYNIIQLGYGIKNPFHP